MKTHGVGIPIKMLVFTYALLTPIGVTIENARDVFGIWDGVGLVATVLTTVAFFFCASRFGDTRKAKGYIFFRFGFALFCIVTLFTYYLGARRHTIPDGEARDLYDAYVRYIAIFASALGAGAMVRGVAYWADDGINPSGAPSAGAVDRAAPRDGSPK